MTQAGTGVMLPGRATVPIPAYGHRPYLFARGYPTLPDLCDDAHGSDTPMSSTEEDEQTGYVHRLRELYRLQISRYPDYPSRYTAHLTAGLRLMGMDIGIVSHIDDCRYTVRAVQPAEHGIAKDDVFELGDTYCARVVGTGAAITYNHVGSDPAMREHPVYREMHLESYIGAPIRVNGRIWGTINFSAIAPRTIPFSKADTEFVELMAQGLGQVIERDVLQQQREEAITHLEQSNELFESAFEFAPVGMLLVDTEGHILRANRALLEMFGYREDELFGRDTREFAHPEDVDLGQDLLAEMRAGQRRSYRLEKRYVNAMGETLWCLVSASLVRGNEGEARYFIAQLLDITEVKHNRMELERQRAELELANHKLTAFALADSLTGLPNRRAFQQRLTEALAASRRGGHAVSVALIDVDLFKQYNDRFGHPAGDDALQAVADAMNGFTRDSDFLARYGGEEFVLIMPETGNDASATACERLRSAVEAISGLKRAMSVSIGAATYLPGETTGPPDEETLIAAADDALYRAKRDGRNRVRYGTLH